MLQQMHDRYKGLLTWIIIIIIAITFAAWGIESYFSSSNASANNVVATVNGVPITQQQFSSALTTLRKDLPETALKNKAALDQLRQTALHQLIVTQALLQTIKKLGINISSDQAGKLIMTMPEFQNDQHQFSSEKYLTMLQNANYTPQQFVNEVRRDLLINQLQTAIKNTAFVLPNEVKSYAELTRQKRDIQYLIVPKKLFATKVSVTSGEEKNYYQEHQTDFQTPEQLSFEYIQLTLNDLAAKENVSDTAIKEYYDNNLANYGQSAKRLVAHILIKLKPEADPKAVEAARKKIKTVAELAKKAEANNFANLAKQYSDDVLTASSGGILPWITSGNIEPELEKAALTLQKSGEISVPIRTRYGFHLLKLLSIEAPTRVPFENAKEQIKEALALQQAQQSFANASEEMANLSYSNPDSLTAIAQAFGLSIQNSAYLTREGNKNGIGSNPKIVTAAFSESVLKQKNNSDVIQINPTTLVVLRVKEYLPPKPLPFNEVQKRVHSKVLALKQKEETEKFVKILKTAAFRKEENGLLQINKLRWNKVNGVTRENKQLEPAILNAVFNLAFSNDPQQLTKISIITIPLSSGDYALAKLERVYTDKPDELALQNSTALKQLLAAKIGQSDFQFYLDEIMKKTKIVQHNF